MNDDTLVVLIHGFCRNGSNLRVWHDALSRDFPHITVADLPTTYSSFEECLRRLETVIAEAQAEKYDKLYIAGHSMGGLLARAYLKKFRPQNARKLLCVGTPHYGSKLADIALLLPGSGLIWKPLHALKTSARKELIDPELPDLEIGVIVGSNNAHWPGKLFLSDAADGLVECFSAHAPDAKHAFYVQVPHDYMQYDPEICDYLLKFFADDL